MTNGQRPSERITEEVTSWPGVLAGPGRRGEFAFKVEGREIGHLHGDDVAHFGFPKHVWTRLFDQGRIDYHPVFPGKPGFGARRIETEEDVRDVIELMRLNYERVRPATGLRPRQPPAEDGSRPEGTGGTAAFRWRRSAAQSRRRLVDQELTDAVHEAAPERHRVLLVTGLDEAPVDRGPGVLGVSRSSYRRSSRGPRIPARHSRAPQAHPPPESLLVVHQGLLAHPARAGAGPRLTGFAVACRRVPRPLRSSQRRCRLRVLVEQQDHVEGNAIRRAQRAYAPGAVARAGPGSFVVT